MFLPLFKTAMFRSFKKHYIKNSDKELIIMLKSKPNSLVGNITNFKYYRKVMKMMEQIESLAAVK